MIFRDLGKTGIKVSLVSCGSGGPSGFGQTQGLSQSEQTSLVRKYIELGVNYFDTAQGYNRSEEILGYGLVGIPRNTYYLSTKWNNRSVQEKELKPPADLVSSVENSLRALRTDYIDVMMFHGVVPADYQLVIDQYYPQMLKLREAGKIRFIGLSEQLRADTNHRSPELAVTHHPHLWDVLMLKYGILNQCASINVFPAAQKNCVGIINMATVRTKLTDAQQLEALIREWKAKNYIPADSLNKTRPLDWLIHDDVKSVIDAGYKFGADHPAVATVLIGTSSISHLENNALALEKPFLPDMDKNRLRQLFGGIAEFV